MSEEIKKALEGLKEVSAALAKSVKEEKDNRVKHDAILEDLKTKQEKFETERKRKGKFDGEDDVAPAMQQHDLDRLMQTKTSNEGIIELQNANDDILALAQILGVDPRETKLYQFHKEHNPLLKKALSSAVATTGDEWVSNRLLCPAL